MKKVSVAEPRREVSVAGGGGSDRSWEGGPAFVLEWLDPATLTAHPDNPRVHSARQREALRASLAEFGWLAAPVWNRRTGRLVDGHARVADAVANPPAGGHVPVRVIDVDEVTERRILASLDRVGELRGYDDEALAALLRACGDDEGFLPGWSDTELEDVLRRAEAALTEPQGVLGEGGEGGGGEVTARPLTSVRMVQLFYGPEEHTEFEVVVSALAERWDLNTPSAVVLQALRGAGLVVDP